MSYNTKILTDGCENLGITLSDTQIEQFMIYYEYLIEKNKVMNLTGITEFEDVMIKHFVDSSIPEGWSSTMALQLVLGGIILVVLGLIGEYIGRIYICINASPQFVEREVVKREEQEN